MNAPKEKNSQALIAIVDDDQSFREALESLLKLIGFRTPTFASARNVLDSPELPSGSTFRRRTSSFIEGEDYG